MNGKRSYQLLKEDDYEDRLTSTTRTVVVIKYFEETKYNFCK